MRMIAEDRPDVFHMLRADDDPWEIIVLSGERAALKPTFLHFKMTGHVPENLLLRCQLLLTHGSSPDGIV